MVSTILRAAKYFPLFGVGALLASFSLFVNAKADSTGSVAAQDTPRDHAQQCVDQNAADDIFFVTCSGMY